MINLVSIRRYEQLRRMVKAQSRLKLSRQSRFDPSSNEIKRMVCFCIFIARIGDVVRKVGRKRDSQYSA
jgi:hypothetical protein